MPAVTTPATKRQIYDFFLFHYMNISEINRYFAGCRQVLLVLNMFANS